MDYSFDPSVNEIACTLTGEKLRTFWPEWHVLRRIGTGAFSDVYQIYRDYYGMHTSSALKVIRMDTGVWSIPPSSAGPAPAAGSTGSDGSAGPGQEGRPLPFAEEVRIMRLLRGAPNIVSIDDFHIHTDESGTYIFIRMELLTSLLEMINSPHRAPMTLSQIRKLGLDVCRALIYCEQNDIIHRDIKPANIFIDRFGNYKVGDFGISRQQTDGSLTFTASGIGTISYMAPEIFAGRRYDSTVDTYALGLILYQLLNGGRMPFMPSRTTGPSHEDVDDSNYHRLHGDPVPSIPGLDRALENIILKACEYRPENRFSSAREMYEALFRYQAPAEPVQIPRRPLAGQASSAPEKRTGGQGSLAGAAAAAPSGQISERRSDAPASVSPAEGPAGQTVHRQGSLHPVRTESLTNDRKQDTVKTATDPGAAFQTVRLSRTGEFFSKENADRKDSGKPGSTESKGPAPGPGPENRSGAEGRTVPDIEPADDSAADGRTVSGRDPAGASPVAGKTDPGRDPADTSPAAGKTDPGRDSTEKNEKRRGWKMPVAAAAVVLAALTGFYAYTQNFFRKEVVPAASAAAVSGLAAATGILSPMMGKDLQSSTQTLEDSPVQIDDPVLEAAVLAALAPDHDRLLLSDTRDLKELVLTIPDGSKDKSIQSLTGLALFPGLEKLSMRSCGLKDTADLSVLKKLQHLRILDLHDNELSDPEPLRSLYGLTYLDLSRNGFKTTGPLADLIRIQSLALYHNEIEDLSGLQGMTMLEELYLDDNKVTDLTPLAALTCLRILRLDDNEITDLSPLQGLTGLQSLNLTDNKVSDLKPLGSLTALQELWLDKNKIEKTGPLSGLQQLTYLNLSSNKVEDLSGLQDLAGLTDLVLSGNSISDLSALQKLSALDYLDLDKNKISDLKPLKDLKALRTLYLNSNEISDLSSLKGLKDLTTLALGSNKIADLSALKDLTKLESLDLYTNQITSISDLEGMKKLTWLNIGRNKVTDLSPVKKMTALESLQCYRNSVSDLTPLEKLTKLKNLVADNNSIKDLTPLKKLKDLENLYLEYNSFSDLTPLKDLSKLRKLYLAGNSISSYQPLESLPGTAKVYRESQDRKNVN